MIKIESIIGNINRDNTLKERYIELSEQGLCEHVIISRLEAERVRLRRRSDKGTDIALLLKEGSRLRNGDVLLLTDDKMIIIELAEEDVGIISIKDNMHNHNEIIQISVKVGHTIGNLHRPIKLQDNKVYFPIQADTELEMFNKLLSSIKDHIVISKDRIVFEPEEDVAIHEH